jgi:hypothetical protein
MLCVRVLLSLRDYEQAVRREKERTAAAITLQAFWRAVRAKQLTKIQRALCNIRRGHGKAAVQVGTHLCMQALLQLQ